MTDYENQLATLRLEVMRLKNYECYSKELPYQDVQTEVELYVENICIKDFGANLYK